MAVSGRRQQLTVSVLQDSDEDLPVCSPCENGGRLIDAHGFCSNCNEHLCEACYKSHLRLKLFKNHVLFDKSSMPREAPPHDDMCTKHPCQQLEYFCENHNKLECSKCVNIYHRTCDNVSYIQDICDDIEATEEFKILYRTLTDIEHDAVQNKTIATTNMTDSQANVNEIKTRIHSYREYLNEQLDEMENAMCDEVDALGSEDKEKLDNVSGECDTLTSNVRSLIHNLNVARKTQQEIRIFIQMKSSQRIIKGWQNQLDDILPKIKVRQYKFEQERRLHCMIEQGKTLGRLVMEDEIVQSLDLDGEDQTADAMEGQTAGAMEDQTTGTMEGQTASAMEDQTTGTMDDQVAGAMEDQTADERCDIQRPDQPPSKEAVTSRNRQLNTPQLVTAIRDERINVKTQVFGKPCNITGSVLTGDNMLAVADHWNKSLKLVDLKRKKVISRLILKDEPWDITRVNKYILAVTCPFGEYIQLVIVTGSSSLTLSRQIRVGGQCCGIRYIDTNGGRLVISFNESHMIKVIDMSGIIMKELSLDAAGRPRFSTPKHITISNDGSTLIVSNEGNNTVTGITLDGEETFVYTHHELVRPEGVAVGDNGEIYVCTCTNTPIHVISNEGRKITNLTIENDADALPMSITYSDNKLFVGFSDYKHIEVYRILYHAK